MKNTVFISLCSLLFACAQTKTLNQLEQGRQCWGMVRSSFYTANPNSPAAWYLSDLEPQLLDFQNQSKATKIEAQHLAYLTNAYNNCYSAAMQPTGDTRYDNLIRTANTATTYTYIELARYANREITRGEYYQRYASIKAGYDISKNQQIESIQQAREEARKKFANALNSAVKAGYRNDLKASTSRTYGNQQNQIREIDVRLDQLEFDRQHNQ